MNFPREVSMLPDREQQFARVVELKTALGNLLAEIYQDRGHRAGEYSDLLLASRDALIILRSERMESEELKAVLRGERKVTRAYSWNGFKRFILGLPPCPGCALCSNNVKKIQEINDSNLYHD